MWFRALRPYRLPSRLGIDAEELERRLQSRTFTACTPAQAHSMGWVPALDDSASALVHAAGPYWMVRLKREEKLLPATVVREQANDRCAQIAKAQGRKVSRRERLAVIDEVTQDLLPRAFTRSSTIRAIIADQAGWIWIDNSSAGRSEEVLNHLREALGNLPAILPETQKAPAHVMTQWLLHGAIPEDFQLADEADFADQREAGSSVKVRGVPLDSEEVSGAPRLRPSGGETGTGVGRAGCGGRRQRSVPAPPEVQRCHPRGQRRADRGPAGPC